MIRITKPAKWKDDFFTKLSVENKLLFIYLYETCDDAGFFEISLKKITAETGISKENIIKNISLLDKAYLVSGDGRKLWLKKFLVHQNKLPLDLKTPEGIYIKHRLEDNNSVFNYPKDFEHILTHIKKHSKNETVFVKPSLDDVIAKYKDGVWSNVSKENLTKAYEHFENKDWTVKNGKQIKDWDREFVRYFNKNKFRKNRMPVVSTENFVKQTNNINENEQQS